MAIPAIIHLQGEDAFFGELDEVPNPTHQFVLLRNIRQKDGKQLAYVADGAQAFLYAWHKITFIEIMAEVALPAGNGVGAPPATAGATSGSRPAGTSVLGFFRDDDA